MHRPRIRSRTAAATAAVVLAVVVVVVAVVIVRGDDGPAYDDDLVRYDEVAYPQALVRLADGEAALSYGPPDEGRYDVQFRDPDGSGWTAPRTVFDLDEDASAFDVAIATGGQTVALSQNLAEGLSEDDDTSSGDVDLRAVCRPSGCTKPLRLDPEDDLGGGVQVAPDGRTALLGAGEGEVVEWTSEGGVQRRSVEGLPAASAEFPDFASSTLLAPDGGLRAVTSVVTPEGCEHTLLAGGPGEDVAEVGRGTGPRPPEVGNRFACGTGLSTFSDDWVRVEAGDPSTVRWFVRGADGGWSLTDEDPSGLDPVLGADPSTCCAQYSGQRDASVYAVAFGSDDGALGLQTRLQGQPSWGPLERYGRAPSGVGCPGSQRFAPAREVGDQVVLLLRCAGEGTSEGEGRLFAISGPIPDGLDGWEGGYVGDLRVGPVLNRGGLILNGDRLVTWTPDEGVREPDLPMPEGAVVSRAPDGTLVQARPRTVSGGCRVELYAAAPDATDWSGPLRSGTEQLPPEYTCRVSGSASDGRGAAFAFTSPRRTVVVTVREEDGRLVVSGL